MKKRLLLAAAVILALALCVAAALFLYQPSHRNPLLPTQPFDAVLTREEAAHDLAFMRNAVAQYHPCYLDGSGRDAVFEAAYARAQAQLDALEEITVGALWAIGAEMYCSLEDAHTMVTCRGSRRATNAAVLTEDVLSVGGIPRAELLSRFRRYYPCEPQVDFYPDVMLNTALATEHWLRLLGVDTAQDIPVETASGTHWLTLDTPEPSAAQSAPFYRWYIDEARGAGVFVLDECTLTEGYQQALKDFFTEVAGKGIGRIAVDLRHNGGGNSQVIQAFMRYIDVDKYFIFGGSNVRMKNRLIVNEPVSERNRRLQPVFSGEVYVLTSHTTFSSAMLFAVTIADNGIGQIIGETPGNMPTAYGDVLSAQAPNSGLVCNMSHKRFFRPNREKDALPLMPDVEVPAEDALSVFLNLGN